MWAGQRTLSTERCKDNGGVVDLISSQPGNNFAYSAKGCTFSRPKLVLGKNELVVVATCRNHVETFYFRWGDDKTGEVASVDIGSTPISKHGGVLHAPCKVGQLPDLPASEPPPSAALPPPAPPLSTQTQVHKQVQVIEDLQLREQPDPRARNILGAPPDDRMPKGSQVAVIDLCRPWMGSGRGERDADNIWCPVLYEGHRGWANAYFLADDHGERLVCVMYPTARGCASAGH